MCKLMSPAPAAEPVRESPQPEQHHVSAADVVGAVPVPVHDRVQPHLRRRPLRHVEAHRRGAQLLRRAEAQEEDLTGG